MIAATCALGLPACGGESAPEGDAAKARSLPIAVTEVPHGRFRYTAPASVQAGLVRITLRNLGTSPHKAQLMRVEGGHTVDEAVKARTRGGPLPNWLFYAGGVGVTPPGASASVLQQLNPGTYYLTGSGSEQGRVATLRVAGNPGEDRLPRARSAISTDEYSFKASGLRSGQVTVAFRDSGLEPHHVVVVPVRPGATAADVRKAYAEGGTAPVDLNKAQETAVLDQAGSQVTELTLRPGSYALLCFVPDRAGGPPHVVRGMVQGITVR